VYEGPPSAGSTCVGAHGLTNSRVAVFSSSFRYLIVGVVGRGKGDQYARTMCGPRLCVVLKGVQLGGGKLISTPGPCAVRGCVWW
jgi:hypothetical protein